MVVCVRSTMSTMNKMHKAEATWQDRVTLEVEKIKSQRQSRKKDEIAKAWVKNRKHVEKSRQEMNLKCPPVPYLAIPKAVANTDPPEGGNPPKKRKFVSKELRTIFGSHNTKKDPRHFAT